MIKSNTIKLVSLKALLLQALLISIHRTFLYLYYQFDTQVFQLWHVSEIQSGYAKPGLLT